jgi:hypothetical protein
MTAFNPRLAAALAVSAVAGVALSAAIGSAAPARPESQAGRAQALTSAPVTDRRGPVYMARTARGAANARAAAVPLPAGGTFNGVQWEVGGDGVAQSDIEGVLEYNATCQWLRAWRQAKPTASEARPSRETALAIRVLQTAPAWPAMRGTESGEVLAQVAADVNAGGGETATAVLADCDASHAREVEYAASLNLAPSR